jgi:hypothetical protein
VDQKPLRAWMIAVSGIVASFWIAGGRAFGIKDDALLTVGGMMVYFLMLNYMRLKTEDGNGE